MKFNVKNGHWFIVLVILLNTVACNADFPIDDEVKSTELSTELEHSTKEISDAEQTSEIDSAEGIICDTPTSIEIADRTPEALGEQLSESSFLTYLGNALIENNLSQDTAEAFAQAKNIFFDESAMTIDGYPSRSAYVYRQSWFEEDVRVFSGVEHYDFTFHNDNCSVCDGSGREFCYSSIIRLRFVPNYGYTHSDKYYYSVTINDVLVYKLSDPVNKSIDKYEMILDENTVCFFEIKLDCEDYEAILAKFIEYSLALKNILE
ncbi:MAG: hypothetical protein IJY39_12840 [Clostridia bacterium]|nr:hypothetical protein [Clostridia bacterium]